MKVQLDFAMAYASILGEKNVDVMVEAEQASLDQVILALMRQYPNWEVLLGQNDLYENGKLKAMFISDQNILSGDSILSDGAYVRILIPICGG